MGTIDAGVLPREAPMDRTRWNAIVIHHSGTPAGDAASIARMHGDEGLAGLGFHFVVGNGQGLPDGFIEVGPRWNSQLPGAHVASRRATDGSRLVSLRADASAEQLNLHAVGVCLIGNGESRAFTDEQLKSLTALVRELQQQCEIPASRVFMHSQLVQVASPGGKFPHEMFALQLSN
jgi:hypothetical protein